MEYLRVGLVSKPQGIKGEIKVQPLTDDVSRFNGMSSILIEGQEYARNDLESVSVRSGDVFLKLKGVDDKNAAERLRGKYLCVEKKDAIPLPPGRYLIGDLIGCSVEGSDGSALGTLRDVLQYPANDVYVIKGKKSFMVPALKKLLLNVDVEQKLIVIDSNILPEVAVYDED